MRDIDVACATKYSPRPPFYIVLTGLRYENQAYIVTKTLSLQQFGQTGTLNRFVDENNIFMYNITLISQKN